MSVRIADAMLTILANAVADQLDAGVGAGTLKLYSGAQPTDPDAAPVGTLLATITFDDPAFGTATIVSSPEDAAQVTVVATGIVNETNTASGTAGWFILEESAGGNVFNGSVTVSGGGGDLELSTLTIPSGGTLELTSGVIRVTRNA